MTLSLQRHPQPLHGPAVEPSGRAHVTDADAQTIGLPVVLAEYGTAERAARVECPVCTERVIARLRRIGYVADVTATEVAKGHAA